MFINSITYAGVLRCLMKKTNIIATAVYILAMLLVCRYIFTSDSAEWVEAATPDTAYTGSKFIVILTLKDPEPGMFASVDLHKMYADKSSLGHIAGTKPVRITGTQRVYEFTLIIPEKTDAAYIFPVIIISGDGSWNTRIRTAEAEPVPLIYSQGREPVRQPESRRTWETSEFKKTDMPESMMMRIFSAAAILCSAALALILRRRFNTGYIAAAALLSSLWEITGSSSISAFILRGLADFAGVYNGRRLPQQVLSILIIAALLFLVVRLVTSSANTINIIEWTSLSLFWIISFLQILSFHGTDSLLAQSIAGFNAGQVAKFAASLLPLPPLLLMLTAAVSKKRANPGRG